MSVFCFINTLISIIILDLEDKIGEIEEKRLSVREAMIWHQFSRLYFCDVYPEKGFCDYTENEKKHGFRQVFYTLEEALEKKNKEARAKSRKKRNEFDDDDDDLD